MKGSAARSAASAPAERLQKLLAQLGLASRRQAEQWIRAGRLTVNDRPAVLGTRVTAQDQLRLDGRLIRRPHARAAAVWLCHRSPGQPLLPGTGGRTVPSFAERLPRRAGRRLISVGPLPTADGGLELLSTDGALAARLQRAVRTLEVEFSVRVRGQIEESQRSALLAGHAAGGRTRRVTALEPLGGEGSNRWYRLVALGMSGAQLRELLAQHGVTLTRALRTRLGTLALPPELPRGRWRELGAAELSGLLGSPDSDR